MGGVGIMTNAYIDQEGSLSMIGKSVGERLLTPQQTATLLSLSPKTLARWRWAGCGPRFIKIGGRVRYAESEIQAFIEAGVRMSTSDMGPVGNGV